jgi:transcriptional regulator of arginine metabolism
VNTSIKSERQRTIRELVSRGFVGSQEELASALRDRGFGVTQATISRDVAELGLVRVARGERHLYLAPEDLPSPPAGQPANDERLRRILADIPVRIGRSGLTLLLIGTPGSASVLGQAVDESSLNEQEGTLAGDNTLLVLFADEARLERWQERFSALQRGRPAAPTPRDGRSPAPAAGRSASPSIPVRATSEAPR